MREKGTPYVDSDGDMGLGKGDLIEVRLPVFQRGLKWNDERVKEFHDSLIQGWPIGVMVLATQESTLINSQTGLRKIELSLIDGQQRTWALGRLLADFWSEPWYTFKSPKWESIGPASGSITNAGAALDALAAALQSTAIELEDAVARLSKKLGQAIFTDYPEFLDALILDLGLTDGLGGKGARLAAKDLCYAILQQYEQLSSIPVPVLLVDEALRSQLPMIFRRLNEGVPLKGYDLLAATWDPVRIKPLMPTKTQTGFLQEVLKIAGGRIEDTYPDDSSGYVIDPNIDPLSVNDLSLFDLLYYISRRTAKNRIFSINSDVLAFQVAAIIFNGSISKVNPDLAKVFPLEDQGTPSISTVPDLFQEAEANIGSALKPLMDVSSANLTLRGKVGLTPAVVYLSTFMTHHNRVVKGAGERLDLRRRGQSADDRMVTPQTFLSNTERLALLKKCLPSWYVHDSLTSTFSGSRAYDAANDRVWRNFVGGVGKKRVYLLEPSNEMLGFPLLSAVLAAFNRLWASEYEVDKTPQRRRVSDGASVLIRAAYSHLQVHDTVLDHVIPMSKGRAAAASRAEIYPLNHVANLMPLTEALNSRRKDEDWDTFHLSLTTADVKVAAASLLCEWDEAASSRLASREQFSKFLRMRFRLLAARALDNLALDEWTTLNSEERTEELKKVAPAP